jgi:hypothetical protein
MSQLKETTMEKQEPMTLKEIHESFKQTFGMTAAEYETRAIKETAMMTYLKWKNQDGSTGERITYGAILEGLKKNLKDSGAVIVEEKEFDQYKAAGL